MGGGGGKKMFTAVHILSWGRISPQKGVKQEWADFYEIINRYEAKMSIRHQNEDIKMVDVWAWSPGSGMETANGRGGVALFKAIGLDEITQGGEGGEGQETSIEPM